jgi:hypothetical protein
MFFIPLVLSVAFMGVGALLPGLLRPETSGVEPWPIWVFGCGFALIGAALLPMGLFLPFGRLKIDLDRDVLRVRSRAGFLSWTRTRPARDLCLFSVVHTPGEVDDRPVTTGPAAELAMLRAAWGGGRTMTLASAYPIGWLTDIARGLSQILEKRGAMEGVRGGQVQATTAVPFPQPAGSNAVLNAFPEGLSLVLPPRGLRRGSSGDLSFGLLWLGVVAVLDTLAYFIVLNFIVRICITGFMILVSCVGFAMIGAAFHRARRRATLEIEGGRLRLSSDGPFGKRRREWGLREIDRIECGPSGRATNGIPHMALMIHVRGQEAVGELEERDPAELRWIAGLLTAHAARARRDP